MSHPIGVFDAGIGSYAIVERVRVRFPDQDILYLADRASFPYGAKSADALLESVARATAYLHEQGCRAVILASNAPSIMVLERLRAVAPVPVIGVFPPVDEALQRSATKQVAVLGVQSMVASEMMRRYVGARANVLLVNASSMVDLVEDFSFLKNPSATQATVQRFVDDLLLQHPGVDVMTLSSTHLPWLRSFFERAAPGVAFLDPADSVLEQVAPYTAPGNGAIRCVATETAAFPLSEFSAALRGLNVPLSVELITL